MAVAGVLHTPEGQLDLGANGGRVDINDPRLHLLHGVEGLAQVVGIDRHGKAVLGGVRHVERLVEIADGQHQCGGTEDLLLRHPHVLATVSKDRRPVEPPIGSGEIATMHQAGVLLLPDIGVLVHLLERGLIDDRPHVGVRLQAVAHLHLGGPLLEQIREILLDFLIHDQAGRGGTALA